MNFLKKNWIADVEATKQNKLLIGTAVLMTLPGLFNTIYETTLRDKIEDEDKAERIGKIMDAVGLIGNLSILIPSTIYQIRRHKIYKSL